MSEATAERLMGTAFIVKERGCVNVKVCSSVHMNTYSMSGYLLGERRNEDILGDWQAVPSRRA